MDIVSRVQNIIMTPQTEWPVIASEPTDPPKLYTSYIILLAAIPPIATFLSLMIWGIGGFRPIGTFAASAIAQYIFTLIGVAIMGFIFAKLAPSFGGQDDVNQGLKLAAYAATPGWVASVFVIIPVIGWIVALVGAIYGLYVLYLGIPVLMKNPQEKTLIYAVAAIVVAIVISFVLVWLRVTILGV
jgi:hypothetical protein